MSYELIMGDCRQRLKGIDSNSIDAIVTDPPYELGFMGKKWDSSGIAFNVEVWQECLRVLKPGGHLLAFGGSRTWHRLTVAIEDAGFEIRDSIAWLYGSGFPKSLDVSKAIDKAAGAEREVVGSKMGGTPKTGLYEAGLGVKEGKYISETAAATKEAQEWQGWGTALKPAFEPVVVARKPLIGTVAENVLAYGTGGLNIDGTRIRMSDADAAKSANNWKLQGYESKENIYDIGTKVIATEQNPHGRWPANVMLDEYTAALLDEQSGITKDGIAVNRNRNPDDYMSNAIYGKYRSVTSDSGYGGQGGASRFFYVAKASKRDRNEGLDELDETTAGKMVDREEGSAGMNSPRAGAGRTSGAKNFHPTVKPTNLMRQLVRLVTPPGGTVLDPFTGSGSTGKAAILEGFYFVGIELTAEYEPIIRGRLDHAVMKASETLT